MMVIEAGLEDRVEQIVAQTRQPGSPYYDINPSGRVPYLVRDDGIGFEDSDLVCAWLDDVAGTSITAIPAGADGWELRRLAAMARSFTEGVSVWFREILRPEEDRSAVIIEHEKERSRRFADVWEREVESPLMQDPVNCTQMLLACGLGLEAWVEDFRWRKGRPRLTAWMDRMSARPSMRATRHPEAT